MQFLKKSDNFSNFSFYKQKWELKKKRSCTGVFFQKHLTKVNLKLFHWCVFRPVDSVSLPVADGNHILAAEYVRNYQRVVLNIFEKILGKIPFCHSHIRVKIQNKFLTGGDSWQCEQMEVSFNLTDKPSYFVSDIANWWFKFLYNYIVFAGSRTRRGESHSLNK